METVSIDCVGILPAIPFIHTKDIHGRFFVSLENAARNDPGFIERYIESLEREWDNVATKKRECRQCGEVKRCIHETINKIAPKLAGGRAKMEWWCRPCWYAYLSEEDL